MEKKPVYIILICLLCFFSLGSILYNKPSNAYEIEITKKKFINKTNDLKLPEVDNNLIYLGEFLITGYCDCPICQGEWVGTTALGIPPTEEWTIAVDPNIIPLGSYISINNHVYKAEDTGSAIIDNRIDIFMGSHEECYSEVCNGYKDVYLIKEEK